MARCQADRLSQTSGLMVQYSSTSYR
jgi:hypothetical protein